MKLHEGDMHKNFEHGERYVLDPFSLSRFPCRSYNPLSEIGIHGEDARETVGKACCGPTFRVGDEKGLAENGARSSTDSGRNDLPPGTGG